MFFMLHFMDTRPGFGILGCKESAREKKDNEEQNVPAYLSKVILSISRFPACSAMTKYVPVATALPC